MLKVAASLLRHHRSASLAFSLLLPALAVPTVAEGRGASDGNIPASMDAPGGTQGNWVPYVLGMHQRYDLTFADEDVFLGKDRSYHLLLINYGSHLTAGKNFTVGEKSNGNWVTTDNSGVRISVGETLTVGGLGRQNSLLLLAGGVASAADVTIGLGNIEEPLRTRQNYIELRDSGTELISEGAVRVGVLGSTNELRVYRGSRVEANLLTIGTGAAGQTALGNENKVTIRGAGSTVEISDGWGHSVVVGQSGSRNQLIVEEDARLAADWDIIIGIGDNDGEFGAENSLLINGMGSVVEARRNVVVGHYGSGNTLTVENEALLMIEQELHVSVDADFATGNYLRINGGFVAFRNDRVAELNDWLLQGKVQTWNDVTQEWMTVTNAEQMRVVYFDDERDAYELTGYWGLDDFTILTSITQVPEAGQVAAVLGLAAAGFLLRRRRK